MRKTLRRICALCLAMAGLPTALAQQAPPPQDITIYCKFAFSSRISRRVAGAQQRLTELGYYQGKANGRIDDPCQAALLEAFLESSKGAFSEDWDVSVNRAAKRCLYGIRTLESMTSIPGLILLQEDPDSPGSFEIYILERTGRSAYWRKATALDQQGNVVTGYVFAKELFLMQQDELVIPYAVEDRSLGAYLIAGEESP